MAGISFKNIKKQYPNGFVAIEGLNLEIKDKEFVVLVGPSGCGKSTTLRMIAGLEEVSDGDLMIGDKVVNNVPPKDRDIAMVFQNYALYPHMSVYDNMAFALKLRKTPKKVIKEKVVEAAKILDIEHLLNKKPKVMSGGQRQRVALGRAIVRHPKVFLLDEPLSNLDAKLRTQMRSEISKLHKKLETTFVYVTHDQTEAMTMGDRIVVMKDGVIQQVDTPFNLYNYPVNIFVAGFIGSPQMNFLKGTVGKRDGEIFIQLKNDCIFIPEPINTCLNNYIGKEIQLGIRPNDVHEGKDPSDLNTYTANVDIVEMMGDELYVHFEFEGFGMIGKFPTKTNNKFETTITFHINTLKIHLFDIDTGNSIVKYIDGQMIN